MHESSFSDTQIEPEVLAALHEMIAAYDPEQHKADSAKNKELIAQWSDEERQSYLDDMKEIMGDLSSRPIETATDTDEFNSYRVALAAIEESIEARSANKAAQTDESVAWLANLSDEERQSLLDDMDEIMGASKKL